MDNGQMVILYIFNSQKLSKDKNVNYINLITYLKFYVALLLLNQ